MRFSGAIGPIKAAATRCVHRDIAVGTDQFDGNRDFLTRCLTIGLMALLAMPFIFVAFRDDGSILAVSGALAAIPFLAFLLTVATGKTGPAKTVLACLLFAALTTLCVATGGDTSPFIVLLPLLALECSIWDLPRGRLVVSACLAAATAVLIWFGTSGSATAIAANLLIPAATILVALYALLAWSRVKEKASEFNRAEARAMAKYDLISKHASEIVSRHDRNGSASFISPSAGEILGVQPADLLENAFIEKIHLQDRIVFLKALSDAFHDRAVQTCELRLRCKDETDRAWKRMAMRVEPIMGSEGYVVAALAISREMQSKTVSAATEGSSAHCASQTPEAYRRFLATISHELRTPLNAIIGFSDVLKQDLIGPLADSRHREYVTHIHESGEHLLSLVNDLIDVSKIDAGKYEISPSSFAIGELILSTVEMLQPIAEKAGVTLCHHQPIPLPNIIADRRACRQIIINLVSNAIKFSPRDSEVRISATLHGRRLKLSVRDCGIGMTKEFAETLGQPFVQAQNFNNRAYEGAGLGLSVVKGLIDLHEGHWKIDTRPNGGTTVTIFLPMRAKASRPKPHRGETDLVRVGNSAKPTHPQNQVEEVKISKGDHRVRVSA